MSPPASQPGAEPGGAWRAELLKSDALGRVERLEGPAGLLVRRLACGGRVPGSRPVARLLMGRERRALCALAIPESGQLRALRVPSLVEDAAAADAAGSDGRVPRDRDVLLRSWIPGVALHRARELPEDFFDLLDELVIEMHRRGVCHNDLHKEQNILVGEGGLPWLVDFQLASVHSGVNRGPHRGVPRGRADEDLRHVQKHRRRYTRDGRGPGSEGGGVGEGVGAGHGMTRGRSARLWRRFVKPIYRALADRLGRRDWEERRPSSGPWPRWTPPLGSASPSLPAAKGPRIS